MTARESNLTVGETSQPFKVVGVSFIPGYPDNIHALRDEYEARKEQALGWISKAPAWSELHDESLDLFDGSNEEALIEVLLIRNPENEHDSNAVQVHVPILGRRHSMIGHIDKNRAAALAPLMDQGYEYEAHVYSVDVFPDEDRKNKPGITIEITLISIPE